MSPSSPIDTFAIPALRETAVLTEARGHVSRTRTARRRRTGTSHPDWLDEIDPRVRALAGIVSLPTDKSDADLVSEAVATKYNALP